jgi:hypothetical protein
MAAAGRRAGWAAGCAAVVIAALPLGGCSSIGGAAAAGLAESLSAAILDASDPALVRDGVPAYLLLMDALVRGSPYDSRILAAAAQLYAAYGIAFVTDPARAALLTQRAREYGTRALCAAGNELCGLDDLDFDAFAARIDAADTDLAPELYAYSLSSLAYIRAHSEDWLAIAAIPKMEHVLGQLLENPQAGNKASINTYLGILNTLRPESLGGKPQVGRAFFEKAIELSAGQDLTAKVEFARGYARLLYDRELHDRLLREVLAAPVSAPGQTLFNTLAKQDAQRLLDTADDYF